MDIDRSQVNFEPLSGEPLQDADTNNTTAKTGSAKRSGFGKKNNGPWLKGGKGGKGPSAKVSKATKTSGKFGGVKKSGKPQGKGNNSKIR
jgi:hypothetical protein